MERRLWIGTSGRNLYQERPERLLQRAAFREEAV